MTIEKSPHWADQAARRVIAQAGNLDLYTVASGITPSGTVHIGNFREVVTVEFVARALKALGKKVRFIYSWDNFDTFRKVPVDLPNQEMLTKELRRPISRIPDPRGETANYAAYGIRAFENELKAVNIAPEFLYQEERYSKGLYAEKMSEALEKKDIIVEILNRFRKEPLESSWLPTAIYCESCQRDTMEYEKYPGGWDYSYKCSTCGHEATTDIRKTKNLKLNWRTDWPMRWSFENVTFEPGGKDHSSEGGSYDTAKIIVKEVWGKDPPVYQQYDFVSIKGGTGKMSSSKGELFTLSQALEVYTPQMVRWIFAIQRPNHDFSLAFDIDVIKTYDEFDRSELSAYDMSKADEGKWLQNRRTYELSSLSEKIADRAPYRAPFRDLCSRLQICDLDAKRTMEKFYSEFVKTEADKEAFFERCVKAATWLAKHAPDEFKYVINKKPIEITLSATQKSFLDEMRKLVSDTDLESIAPKDLNQLIYDKAIHATNCEPKDAFIAIYQKLIHRDQGPRLPSFLKEIGKERILQLI